MCGFCRQRQKTLRKGLPHPLGVELGEFSGTRDLFSVNTDIIMVSKNNLIKTRPSAPSVVKLGQN